MFNSKSTSASTSTSNDIYSKITEQIIAKIQAGAGEFEMPWHKTKTGTLITPINAVTGNNYKGVNIVSLWASAMSANYSSGVWATYKQWSDLGAQVRKGEKASLIVFYKSLKIVGKHNDSDEGEQQEPSSNSKQMLYARTSFVFNSDQVDGYKPPPEPTFNLEQPIENAEKFFGYLGATIEHGGNKACYFPGFDKIQMPKFEAFNDSNSYYAILAHEVTHWTGHASRCNRDLSGRFKTRSYAAEELIAELGAAFLCSLLGLSNEPRQDHAAYIASWLELLKDDNRAIFTAASKAQQAIDWLQAKQPQIQLLSA